MTVPTNTPTTTPLTTPLTTPTATGVPLVDLAPWYSGDPGGRRAVARAVDDALRFSGFLLVTGHPFEADLTDDVRAAALQFFRLPEQLKRQYASAVGGRGWIPPGAEANAASDGLETPPDLKESFSFGPATIPVAAITAGEDEWYADNVWPEELPDMEARAWRYAAAAARLADDLLEIFAVALNLPIEFFTSRCDRSPWQVNLNWYPARDTVGTVADGQFRIGQHTDFGTLTILDRQPGSGGLQVCTLDGDWIDAPFVPGSLTINSGDLLARWSGDRWRSTLHRVLPPPADAPTEELVSLVFFHEANPSTLIETLPSPDDQAAHRTYEPVTAGEFLRMRLDSITVATAP